MLGQIQVLIIEPGTEGPQKRPGWAGNEQKRKVIYGVRRRPLVLTTRAGFISKLCIACKEARETLYGLDFLVAGGIMKEGRVSELVRECDEMLAILTAAVKRCEEHRS